MQKIDRIVFGDNQFFGINHMSQEKAQQLSEQFHDIENIIKVYDIAIGAGIRSIMLNSNDRAKEICEHFINNQKKYPSIEWYPSIPYPHKYANLVSEKGIIPAITEIIFKGSSSRQVFETIKNGTAALMSNDLVHVMKMLIDVEMKIYKGLNIKVIFLQNIIVDLILGLDIPDLFIEYCVYVRKRYSAIPGFITQNLPMLKAKIEKWGIEDIVICSSFNKIGYLMSPNIESYITAANLNDPDKYQLMAMSTLASGAISPSEAYEFINKQKLQSIVFGASTKKHIEETISLIGQVK